MSELKLININLNNEIWQDVIGYEGLYQVSNLGRIKSLKRQWKNQYGCFGTKKETGYFVACLSKDGSSKWIRVHRIVAQTFIPNPENKPEVNHINGIKTDNRVENLEWVTHSENGLHCWRTGLRDSGEQTRKEKISKGNRILKRITKEIVLDVYNNCILGSKDKNAHVFSRKHNINLQTICNIKNLANPTYREIIAGRL